MALNAPFKLTTTQNRSTNNGNKFPWAIGFNQNVPLVKNIGLPNQVGLVGFSAEDQNINSSYIYQYSLGIQRRLGSAFSLEVDYQGSNGHALGLFVDQNQPRVIVNDPTKPGNQAPNVQIYPYPLFGSVGPGKDIANSNYNPAALPPKSPALPPLYFHSSSS